MMIEYNMLIPVSRRGKELSAEERIQQMTPFLLRWYQQERRILPWRENPVPYYVWISEIMLQQTRVEAMKPYFARFINALPDISALAAVEEETLLKLWEGLGYYNRAKNLKKAAQIVVEQYGGEMPADYNKLLDLPGIGSYTAGAIASIAFGLPVPAVDGNVLRVLSRFLADGSDIWKQSVKKQVEELLGRTMPRNEASAFNQAMMEIGAVVCLPNGLPLCEVCPMAPFCLSKILGTQLFYPVKKVKKARKVEARTVLLLIRGNRQKRQVALRKRENVGLLAGMYEFPNLVGSLSEKEVVTYLKQQGIFFQKLRRIEDAKHIFSHIEWHMTGYEVVVECDDMPEGIVFVELAQLRNEYPVPSAFAAYKKWLAQSAEGGIEDEGRVDEASASCHHGGEGDSEGECADTEADLYR